MAEELGKIEKPSVEEYQQSRKLYFIPLIVRNDEAPVEYLGKFNKFWDQVEKQITELEGKLGAVKRIYHEMVPVVGEEGVQAIEELCDRSGKLVKEYVTKGAQLEALEDTDILTEFMDWSRCLIIGLQNERVARQVYESYLAAGKKRNEAITEKIDKTLLKDESGILVMRENHQVQFPADIQLIYVAPPALDEIKRWLREQETSSPEQT